MKTGYNNKLKKQTLLSSLLCAIGIVLVAVKIYADSEPGAIPLLLIVLGTGWLIITRLLIRSQQT